MGGFLEKLERGFSGKSVPTFFNFGADLGAAVLSSNCTAAAGQCDPALIGVIYTKVASSVSSTRAVQNRGGKTFAKSRFEYGFCRFWGDKRCEFLYPGSRGDPVLLAKPVAG